MKFRYSFVHLRFCGLTSAPIRLRLLKGLTRLSFFRVRRWRELKTHFEEISLLVHVSWKVREQAFPLIDFQSGELRWTRFARGTASYEDSIESLRSELANTGGGWVSERADSLSTLSASCRK